MQLCKLLQKPPRTSRNPDIAQRQNPPKVDEVTYIIVGFLTAVAKCEIKIPLISSQEAVDLLGTMMRGYNVQSLLKLLKSQDVNIAQESDNAISKTLLVFDAFNGIQKPGFSTLADRSLILEKGDRFLITHSGDRQHNRCTRNWRWHQKRL